MTDSPWSWAPWQSPNRDGCHRLATGPSGSDTRARSRNAECDEPFDRASHGFLGRAVPISWLQSVAATSREMVDGHENAGCSWGAEEGRGSSTSPGREQRGCLRGLRSSRFAPPTACPRPRAKPRRSPQPDGQRCVEVLDVDVHLEARSVSEGEPIAVSDPLGVGDREFARAVSCHPTYPGSPSGGSCTCRRNPRSSQNRAAASTSDA